MLPQQSLNEGWISLFDGETMFGWQPSGDAKWEIVDGEIRTDGAKNGWLMTTTEWADYELHVEFKAAANTNSGVFLRTPLKPTDPTKDCYEVNIAPEDNPFPTGSIVGRQKGNLVSKEFPAADQWHSIDVVASRGDFTVRVNDKLTLQYKDSNALDIGYIGLQSREGKVAFRNLRLKPLSLKSLFDGKDLQGWSTDRAKKCKFDVTKGGELHMSNGPGQIDTAADFTNFALQIDCKANGEGLNSGVFFRTLREGWCAGYESQIQNGFKDGDRTKPKDFGTGAIYRRQPARYVVPNDHEVVYEDDRGRWAAYGGVGEWVSGE